MPNFPRPLLDPAARLQAAENALNWVLVECHVEAVKTYITFENIQANLNITLALPTWRGEDTTIEVYQACQPQAQLFVVPDPESDA